MAGVAVDSVEDMKVPYIHVYTLYESVKIHVHL